MYKLTSCLVLFGAAAIVIGIPVGVVGFGDWWTFLNVGGTASIVIAVFLYSNFANKKESK